MIRKILIQTFVCLIAAFALITGVNSEVDVIQKHAASFIDHMSVNYTKEDVKAAFANAANGLKALTDKTSDAIDVMTGKPIYGEPIDETFEGNEAPVYAVGGGKVTAVGENEEIGRYVKIKHGDQAESLYGNLGEIHVIASANVKKGQIIGIYKKNDDKDFYYSFKEF